MVPGSFHITQYRSVTQSWFSFLSDHNCGLTKKQTKTNLFPGSSVPLSMIMTTWLQNFTILTRGVIYWVQKTSFIWELINLCGG